MAKFYRIDTIVKDAAIEILETVVKAGVSLSPNLLWNSTAGADIYNYQSQRAIKTIVPVWRQFHADAERG